MFLLLAAELVCSITAKHHVVINYFTANIVASSGRLELYMLINNSVCWCIQSKQSCGKL